MVKWEIVYTKQAVKVWKKINQAGLKPKVEKLITTLENDRFDNSHHFEKLVGKLSGAYSRRINIQHRLVYQVLEKGKTVKILRMWTHNE